MITLATIEVHQRELKKLWRAVVSEPVFNWKMHEYQITEAPVTKPSIDWDPVKEKLK